MHENKNVYSIYMIIDNLDDETRRNQIRLESMQLNFLSMIKSQSIAVKARVYHLALKIMLKLTFSTMIE